MKRKFEPVHLLLALPTVYALVYSVAQSLGAF